jgi:chaperone modulatory protein CbpM
VSESDIHVGILMEGACLTIEQFAAACAVERAWVERHVSEGLVPAEQGPAQEWRFSTAAVRRARRMLELERDFDAVPELAALFADLLEEMDAMRAALSRR